MEKMSNSVYEMNSRHDLDSSKQIRFLDIGVLDVVLTLIGFLWLALMLISSTLFSGLKAALLMLLCVLSVIDLLVNKIEIKLKYFFLTIVFIAIFMSSLIVGFVSGFPFEANNLILIRYYAITPICVLIVGMVFYTQNRICLIEKSLLILSAVICFIDVLFILNIRGVFPYIPIFKLLVFYGQTSTREHLAMRVTNETALVFLLPYCIARLSTIRNEKSLFNKVCLIIAVFSGIVFTLLSGRKSLEIVVLGSIIFSIIFSVYKNKMHIHISSIFIVIIVMFASYLIINKVSALMGLENLVSSARDTFFNDMFKKSGGIDSRSGDIQALYRMWTKDIGTFFFGNGLNSYARDSLASYTTPWSYEVFFNALLAQTGIIGVGVITYVLCIFIKSTIICYRITNHSHHLGIIIGTVAFVFASATNPMFYLSWFWIILWSEKIYLDYYLAQPLT